MLLALDIGNTEIACGLYQIATNHSEHKLRAHWRLRSAHSITDDELRWQLFGQLQMQQLPAERIRAMIVASVVPSLDSVVRQACAKLCSAPVALIGDPDLKIGIELDYLHPEEIGADRIVNAVAARHRFGSPVIVLDFGTATTFDVVSANGHYAGGLILAGVDLALGALAQRAARLPEVSLTRTKTVIAKETVHAMQAGSYWGAVEAINGLIRRLHSEMGSRSVPVIATGGMAAKIAADIEGLTALQPQLTLDGLAMLGATHFGTLLIPSQNVRP
ncbi:MAG: type III pantothenate kinase [Mariprofundales bacterium]|nr:type III pantothenate kinase [Mariprofundales bacterium]